MSLARRVLPSVLVLAGLLALLAPAPTPAHASILSVTTTDDELTTNGRCSLREAIRNANANAQVHTDCPPGDIEDTILLNAATYRLTIAGANEDQAATGDLDLIGKTTIVGGGPGVTAIDANGLERVLELRQGDVAILRSLTIRGAAGEGGIANRGTMTLENVAITENFGGGIVNYGTLTALGSTIANNQSLYGGGIRNEAGTLTLQDVEITRNAAIVATITSGTAGGVYNWRGTLVMRGGTIANNAAQHGTGGGIDHYGGSVELTNVTISGNSAFFGGGAIRADSGSISLTNVTIWDNTVGFPPPGSGQNISMSPGGGTTIRARNTIVANDDGVPNCTSSLISDGNNLESGSTCGFSAGGDRQNTAPLLGPLADNGGPTRTHALLPGSPAIDGGTNTGCPPTDQRGARRPRDGDGDGQSVCDIGAFEAASAPVSNCSPRPDLSVRASPIGGGRLLVTLAVQTNTGLASNAILGLKFTRLENAIVEVGGAAVPIGTAVAVPPAAQQYSFEVRRVTSGQPTMVHFTARDACGDWPSFIGGGPSAF